MANILVEILKDPIEKGLSGVFINNQASGTDG
jgi:hypothetical protein